jgi:hypothetical protein
MQAMAAVELYRFKLLRIGVDMPDIVREVMIYVISNLLD